MRLGPGPVFAYEWLTTTRRWQLYALRGLFVGLILAGMIFIWQVELSRTGQGPTVSIQQLAEYGERFYTTIVSIELTLVLLAAPAATAGAICLDKARGTLDHMLATDLSNAEIVLGKLGAAARAGARVDRLRRAHLVARRLAGRHRSARALRLVLDRDCLRRAGLLARLDSVGLGPKDPRSADADLFDTHLVGTRPAALDHGFVFDHIIPCYTGPSGNRSFFRIRTTLPSHLTRSLARSV